MSWEGETPASPLLGQVPSHDHRLSPRLSETLTMISRHARWLYLVAILLVLSIFAWSISRNPQPVQVILTPKRVVALKFHPTRSLLATGGLDHRNGHELTVFEFNTLTRTSAPVFTRQGSHCIWTPDGEQLIASLVLKDKYPHSIVAYRLKSWNQLWEVSFPDSDPCSLAYVASNEIAAIGGMPGEGGWFDHRTAKIISPNHSPIEFGSNTHFVWSLSSARVGDTSQVAISYCEKDASVEIGTIQWRDQIPFYQKQVQTDLKGQHTLAYTEDGSELIAVSPTQIVVLNANTGQVSRSIPVDRRHGTESTDFLQTLSVSKDGRRIAYIEKDRVVVAHLTTLEEQLSIRVHSNAIEISPDGQHLAVSRTAPHRVELYDISEAQ